MHVATLEATPVSFPYRHREVYGYLDEEDRSEDQSAEEREPQQEAGLVLSRRGSDRVSRPEGESCETERDGDEEDREDDR